MILVRMFFRKANPIQEKGTESLESFRDSRATKEFIHFISL